MGRARFWPRNHWLVGVSAIALIIADSPALAQDSPPTEPDSTTVTTAPEADAQAGEAVTTDADEIVVTGIRAASRSFDFANLASEGIAAVEVHKSGRATLPTGGIGSVINIVTPRPLSRPGFQGSVAVKGVYDTSRFDGTKITPEVSGIISNTFADGTIGILLSGSYQRRKASLAQFNAGWREGFLGSDSCAEGAWGALPRDANDWCGSPNNITNRPGPTDVYQTPQNAGYDFTDIDRKRINGQLVLQARPVESLTATIDYTYSKH